MVCKFNASNLVANADRRIIVTKNGHVKLRPNTRHFEVKKSTSNRASVYSANALGADHRSSRGSFDDRLFTGDERLVSRSRSRGGRRTSEDKETVPGADEVFVRFFPFYYYYFGLCLIFIFDPAGRGEEVFRSFCGRRLNFCL